MSKKAEEIYKQSKSEVLTFINNPVHRQIALQLAMQMYTGVSQNWFTVEDLIKEAKLNAQEAIQKLEMLALFGFIRKSERKGEWIYKVTMELDEVKETFDKRIAQLEDEKLLLEQQRSDITRWLRKGIDNLKEQVAEESKKD